MQRKEQKSENKLHQNQKSSFYKVLNPPKELTWSNEIGDVHILPNDRIILTKKSAYWKEPESELLDSSTLKVLASGAPSELLEYKDLSYDYGQKVDKGTFILNDSIAVANYEEGLLYLHEMESLKEIGNIPLFAGKNSINYSVDYILQISSNKLIIIYSLHMEFWQKKSSFKKTGTFDYIEGGQADWSGYDLGNDRSLLIVKRSSTSFLFANQQLVRRKHHHLYPSFLPDGESIVSLDWGKRGAGGNYEEATVYLENIYDSSLTPILKFHFNWQRNLNQQTDFPCIFVSSGNLIIRFPYNHLFIYELEHINASKKNAVTTEVMTTSLNQGISKLTAEYVGSDTYSRNPLRFFSENALKKREFPSNTNCCIL